MDSLPIGGEYSLGQNDGNNHSVESEGLSEDENKNHSDEDLFLLCVSSDSSITNNSNSKSGSLSNISPISSLREMRDRSKVRRRGACSPCHRCNQ
jgi:hypothetical protein